MRPATPVVLLVLSAGALALSPGASAATRCVGGSGCYPTLQAAVDAAGDGDTIALGAGTFEGGVKIDVSVRLRGVSAAQTIIRGGGPVLTIGRFGAFREPSVIIDRVTVTGGVTTSSWLSDQVIGTPGVAAKGGGISVPPAAGFRPGATLLIRDSVITGNRAAPVTSLPSGNATCPGSVPCPFATAQGGGIDTWGPTTLQRTLVSNNEVSGPASDANGGGIASFMGGLTLIASTVADNRALASEPNGRFAEGGGLFVNQGSLTVQRSTVSGNTASLTTDLPAFVDGELVELNAHAGGIHVGDGVPTGIFDTRIVGNVVEVQAPSAEALAFDAGMLMGHGPLTMARVTISGNRVTAHSLGTEDTGSGGTALEVDGGGTISNLRLTDNLSQGFTQTGRAGVNSGIGVLNFDGHPRLLTISDSVIGHNTAEAVSTAGVAVAQGGGIFNNSLLALRNVRIADNTAHAEGPTGVAQGGGIWNGVQLSGPPVRLDVAGSRIVRNRVSGSAGIAISGGGIFTATHADLAATRIRRNDPDDCVGSSCLGAP
jgi:hypothetical protein